MIRLTQDKVILLMKLKEQIKEKSKLIVITTVIVLLLSVIGITYAYFTVIISGNETATSIITKTANLGLIYESGNEIYIENALPGWSETKIFTVENVSPITIYYDIVWDDILNTVEYNDLVYYIACGSDIEESVCSGKSETKMPGGGSLIPVIQRIKIEPGELHTYELTVEFLNREYAQDENQDKIFAGKIQILESGSYETEYASICDSPQYNQRNLPISNYSGITENTIYDYLKGYDVPNGTYSFTLANGVVLNFEIYTFNEDVIYSSTPTLCDSVADTKMCILKYKANLTIESNVTITPQVRKKGFTIYVEGKLINDGTISMTARGAKAVGQELLLSSNLNGTYETIPAAGGAGGAGHAAGGSYGAGTDGSNGLNRMSGGGGGGSNWGTNPRKGGDGSAGTSYSGGSGGGGVYNIGAAGTYDGGNGESNGGAGGNGAAASNSATYSCIATGGAGNDRGLGALRTTSGNSFGTADWSNMTQDGTGGLLIIYANELDNQGVIVSRGSNVIAVNSGGYPSVDRYAGGGASGGGSINIFYNTLWNEGIINASGGITANQSTQFTNYGGGGRGGDGTITKSILDICGRLIELNPNPDSSTDETIYGYISRNDDPDGNYSMNLANGSLIDYEIYSFDENVTYTSTPTLCDETKTKMCILKYKGNLTVNAGVTVTPQVTKKGFTIYVEGTLTNNGTITMDAKGAAGVGQNVQLYKNNNGTYETVPAIGAGGGSGVTTTPGAGKAGNSGVIGTGRRTGGGGSGGIFRGSASSSNCTSGAGSMGTSYSGGSGGGGHTSTYNASLCPSSGTSPGTTGAGGKATTHVACPFGIVACYTYHAIGGVGITNGANAFYNGSQAGSYSVVNNGSGTGGLLIIYTNTLVNNNIISSNGVKANSSTLNSGTVYRTSGGSSGGGSVNIFYQNLTTKGAITASGGASSTGHNANGGAGGNGSVTLTQMN